MPPSFTVYEGAKRVFFFILVIVFCVLAWMVLSVIAGQTGFQVTGMGYPPPMPHRLIGAH